MSSATLVSPSCCPFRDRWDAALTEYTEKTGIDLTTNDYTKLFKICDSADGVCAIVQEQLSGLKPSRANTTEWGKLRQKLKSVAALVLKFNGAIADEKFSDSPNGRLVVVAIAVLITATKGASELNQFIYSVLCKLEDYLERSSARLEETGASAEIATKVFVEVLAVLAPALESIHANHYSVIEIKYRGPANFFRAEHRRRAIMESGRMRNALLRLEKLGVGGEDEKGVPTEQDKPSLFTNEKMYAEKTRHDWVYTIPCGDMDHSKGTQMPNDTSGIPLPAYSEKDPASHLPIASSDTHPANAKWHGVLVSLEDYLRDRPERSARALHSHTASRPNEVSFAEGDILEVLDMSGPWWIVRKAEFTVGIAPPELLELFEPEMPRWHCCVDRPDEKVIALYGYTPSANNPYGVSFSVGEIMVVISKMGRYTMLRKADGTVGIAPSKYLWTPVWRPKSVKFVFNFMVGKRGMVSVMYEPEAKPLYRLKNKVLSTLKKASPGDNRHCKGIQSK